MKDISVLIPDGDHPLALRVMRSLGQSRRVTVDLVVSNPRHPHKFSRHCRSCHVAGSAGGPARSDAILNAIRKGSIDVLLPVSVEGIGFVAAERATFSEVVALPPLPDMATLDTANNKVALCQFARQHGVATPPFLVFPDQVPDLRFLDQLRYPVLRKPPALEGGRGIEWFDDPATLRACLEINSAPCLLQTYVEGDDFGLNVLCRDGEILASSVQRNLISASPPFGPAAGIHLVEDVHVIQTGQKLLSALGWSGVANLDMIRSAATGETMLLEMNPRYWGTVLGSTRAGVNFPYLACLAATGRPLLEHPYMSVSYADTSVALGELFRIATGRRRLPRFRLTNTALWTAVRDPLPLMDYGCKRAMAHAAGGVTKTYRRARGILKAPTADRVRAE